MTFATNQRVILARKHKSHGMLGLPESYLGRCGAVTGLHGNAAADDENMYSVKFDGDGTYQVYESMLDISQE